MRLTIFAIILTICIAYIARVDGTVTTDSSAPTTFNQTASSKSITSRLTKTSISPNKSTPPNASSGKPASPSSKPGPSTNKPVTTTGGSSSVAPSMWMITLITVAAYKYMNHQ